VGVALAQDADRITRDPGHRAFLDDDFERLGSRLVALDDWGDDTHEGELLKFLKGWVSKGERLKIAERSRRGMLRKPREGKIILPPIPDYGFEANETRDGYDVDQEKMELVRSIFRVPLWERAQVLVEEAPGLPCAGMRRPRQPVGGGLAPVGRGVVGAWWLGEPYFPVCSRRHPGSSPSPRFWRLFVNA
jgi:hypothetical protein